MNKVKQFIFINVVLLVTCLITNAQDTICLDGNSEGRIFEGICGVNAGGGVGRLLINYPEPQRSEILDYLFKPNYGASVHAYKAEIGGDGNSTEGSEPSHMHTADDQNYKRGYQWWMMKEAKKRNPDIKLMALAWDFPAWIKDVCSQAAADYLVNYIKGAKSVHNLDIDYIGMWNETKTCNKLAKLLRKTLDANGLQKVKIIGDDQVRNWSIADAGNSEQLGKHIRLWTPRKRPTMAFISLSNWVTSLKPVNDALKELGPEYIAVTPEQLADLFWKSKKK